MFGWTIERKPATPAEEKLEQIRDILFPKAQLMHDVDPKTGQEYKWQVEYAADMNLDAALIDLQEGHNDKAVHNTVKGVVDMIMDVRKILDEHMELSSEAKYIMVENKRDTIDDKDIT